MSTASIDRPTGQAAAGAVVPLAAARWLRGWLPLHGWSARRRLAVAAVIGAATSAVATGVCVALDLGGPVAAEAALSSARRQLADARRVLDTLPESAESAGSNDPERPAARAAQDESQQAGRPPDDARDVSELAAATGVGIVSLEPVAPRAQDEPRGSDGKRDPRGESFRVLKLTAQGDFPQIRAFLRGLARAPALTVPSEATLTRNGSRLSLAATLSVFDGLPSPADGTPSDAAASRLSDPFMAHRADGTTTAGGLRLAGVLWDRSRGLALIETPRGTETVEQGARIDAETVASIDAGQVTLAADGTTRVLKWAEDGR